MQKVVTTLVDDITGDDADETVSFALDGRQYEVDLTSENATELRSRLMDFITHGRRSGSSRPTRRSASGPNGHAANAEEVRAWAKANGHEVSERGRISVEVRKAYEKAHSLSA